jgi:hypothetical protein
LRILFDQGTPVPLRQVLSSHTVNTAKNHLGSILNALDSVRGGDYLEVSFSGEQNLP